ncbi:PREDICTED: squalene synthase [Condylura cristata]|uniref:squalene synthase n=1 Tax=Condylura cristata TaxID=143302 RepID=UPI000642CCE2|nr:PREDICTED: squalene synthase [Condylura cristata]
MARVQQLPVAGPGVGWHRPCASPLLGCLHFGCPAAATLWAGAVQAELRAKRTCVVATEWKVVPREGRRAQGLDPMPDRLGSTMRLNPRGEGCLSDGPLISRVQPQAEPSQHGRQWPEVEPGRDGSRVGCGDQDSLSSSLKTCYKYLNQTSRSFAAVIEALDGEMRHAVCIFYLVLRALDTVEDDMSISVDRKVPLLLDFHTFLYDPEWRFMESKEKDRQVLEDFPTYCHYVAGLVGIGLSRLFSASEFEDPLVGEDTVCANSLGLFLQKTNIIRDYLEDQEEGREFWPQAVGELPARGGVTLGQRGGHPNLVTCLLSVILEMSRKPPRGPAGPAAQSPVLGAFAGRRPVTAGLAPLRLAFLPEAPARRGLSSPRSDLGRGGGRPARSSELPGAGVIGAAEQAQRTLLWSALARSRALVYSPVSYTGGSDFGAQAGGGAVSSSQLRWSPDKPPPRRPCPRQSPPAVAEGRPGPRCGTGALRLMLPAGRIPQQAECHPGVPSARPQGARGRSVSPDRADGAGDRGQLTPPTAAASPSCGAQSGAQGSSSVMQKRPGSRLARNSGTERALTPEAPPGCGALLARVPGPARSRPAPAGPAPLGSFLRGEAQTTGREVPNPGRKRAEALPVTQRSSSIGARERRFHASEQERSREKAPERNTQIRQRRPEKQVKGRSGGERPRHRDSGGSLETA